MKCESRSVPAGGSAPEAAATGSVPRLSPLATSGTERRHKTLPEGQVGALFVAQGHGRVHADGSTGGQIRRGQSHQRERGSNGPQDDGVARLHAVEQTSEQT